MTDMAVKRLWTSEVREETEWQKADQHGRIPVVLASDYALLEQRCEALEIERDAAARLNGGDYYAACQAALREGVSIEACCQAIRAGCEACGGSGYGQCRYDEHGAFVDGDECEYCGRPIAILRAMPALREGGGEAE